MHMPIQHRQSAGTKVPTYLDAVTKLWPPRPALVTDDCTSEAKSLPQLKGSAFWRRLVKLAPWPLEGLTAKSKY
jgi:hypothetical protein